MPNLEDIQYRERQALKRAEKVQILAQYFENADDLIDAVDSIPDVDFKDPERLVRELARIDLRADQYKTNTFTTFMGGMGSLALLGINHEKDILASNFFSMDALDRALFALALPFEKDRKVLVNAGVYEPHNLTDTVTDAFTVAKSTNRFNAMLENIGRLEDKKLQKKAYQALANYADAGDPLGATVRQTIQIFGVKPTRSWPLSQRIWGEDKRNAIYKKIISDANAGKSPSQIVDELQIKLKEANEGGQYYQAERIVDTELQRAYSEGKFQQGVEVAEATGEKLYYARKLSPAHRVPCICEDLVGRYPLDQADADVRVPSHPFCACLEMVGTLKQVKSFV